MSERGFETFETAWCPGCGNFNILDSLKNALTDLQLDPHDVLMVGGIGQAAKLPQYISANSFCGLHGRSVPPAAAAKIVNPGLTVIINSGDGDSYGEGGNHFIHNIRRNIDIAHFIHDNQVYGLTKGQTSPASSKGFVTKTTPDGNPLTPLAVPAMAIAAGATFVAQAYAIDGRNLVDIIEKAVDHKGFSYVNIFTPCVTFNHMNTVQWYNEHLKKISDVRETYDPSSKAEAFHLLAETDSLVTGVIYEEKEGVPFGDIVPSKDVRLIDHVEKPSEALFEDLCKEFR